MNDNQKEDQKTFICLKEEPEFLYAVMLNHKSECTKKCKNCFICEGLYFVKVGMTRGTIRPENVKQQINKWCKEKKVEVNAEILFAIKTDPHDSRPLETLEERLRQKMGYLLDSFCIKEMGLPVPTEWCLSTDKNIKHVQKEKPTSYDALNNVKTCTHKQPKAENITFPTLPIRHVIFYDISTEITINTKEMKLDGSEKRNQGSKNK